MIRRDSKTISGLGSAIGYKVLEHYIFLLLSIKVSMITNFIQLTTEQIITVQALKKMANDEVVVKQ